ncbi:MAG: sulfotransferase [Thermodesulfobacteriota bacterium]
MNKPEIVAPIFIIGCHRSGTSIFYRKLALHPDLAYITRTTRRAPNRLVMMRLFHLFRSKEKNITPIGGEFWNKFDSSQDQVMRVADVTPKNRIYFERLLRNHLMYFNRPRFLNKSPSNSVKIDFLNELFPDAVFIHMIRDGRAVARSISVGRFSHGRFSGAKIPGWQDILKRPAIESCGLQWKKTVEFIQASLEKIPSERVLAVRYEDFVARPVEIMQRVGETCGLQWNDEILTQVAGGLRSRNYKWKDTFSQAEIDLLNDLLGRLLTELGYEV